MTPEHIVANTKVGMSRQQVVVALGEPTDKSCRDTRRSSIYKYGDIELHFLNDKLWLIFSDTKDGVPCEPVTYSGRK